MATRKNKMAADFCRCIKKVRKTIKLRPGVKNTPVAREAAAIGVCVKSILQTRGKTLKRFKCGKRKSLTTQKPLKGGFFIGDSQPMPIQHERDMRFNIRSWSMGGGGIGAPYESTDPTASKIQPGSGIQSYYDNAVKAPVRL